MIVEIEQFLRTVTRAVSALREDGVRFAVAGGAAVYAHGGPASEHDVDIFVKPEDAPAARKALVRSGMRAVDPPEDWLIKVYDDTCLVDLIFRPIGGEVSDQLLDQAEEHRIGPTEAPVLPATVIVIDKLLVLGPHNCDFTPLLSIVRALREQIDWTAVAEATADSAYARAFCRLTAELGLVDGRPPSNHEPTRRVDAPAR